MNSRGLYKTETYVFELDKKRILFDVLRGSFFEVDDLTADVLRLSEDRAPEEILNDLGPRYATDEVRSVIEELVQEEILSAEPIKVARFHPPSRLELSHISLCMTRDKAEGLEGKGNNEPPARRTARKHKPNAPRPQLYMSEGAALASVDFLLRESGSLRHCTVTFEGGDPLLNLPLIKRVIEYGEEQAGALGKEISFEVVTAGSLLTDRIATYLAEKHVAIVLEVQVEGDRAVLDRAASALRMGSRAASLHLQVVARGGKTELRKRIEELLDTFPYATSIGVRWASAPSGHPDAQGPEHLPWIREAISELGRYTLLHLLGGGQTVLEDIEGPMAQLMERQVLLYGCGAGTRSVAVSPEGYFYPCPDLVGWEKMRVGDVVSGMKVEKYREWLRALHVEQRERCRSCWARYLCGGGCMADAYFATGDPSRPNETSCERIRHTYELAMLVCLEGEEQDPGMLASRFPSACSVSQEVQIPDERAFLERYA